LPENVRLGSKWLAVPNTPAYNTGVSVTVVKSFRALARYIIDKLVIRVCVSSFIINSCIRFGQISVAVHLAVLSCVKVR
jgi:hypothetical protein